jgi:uncharacterized repeat protein (TIGR03803 family)
VRQIRITFSLAVLFTLTSLCEVSATAQTFTVLHNFTGQDGAGPSAGITFGPGGSLYGTTATGGSTNNGVVFKLTRVRFDGASRIQRALVGTDDGRRR